MFGLSGEHLLILGGILLIFGPKKLPELGSSIGKAMRNFKEGLNNPQTSGTLEARNATPIEKTEILREIKTTTETVNAQSPQNPTPPPSAV